jgi:alpha-D-ribose 1-methylphosphonate 5-triphosphate synthase subunit PhnH
MNATTTPHFTGFEARTRSTFLALMWALSYPGRPHALPVTEGNTQAAFEAIGETLLDLETRYYTPDAALNAVLQRTTSHPVPPAEADYLFFPVVTDATLTEMAQAKLGTMLYPDHAATLIIGCSLSGAALTLRGPGIKGEAQITIGAVPDGFWELRNKTRRFPLGWDIVLVANQQVIGLPRSTQVLRENC